MDFTATNKYRKDIDGLRAIAVLAVIAFHFGILPNGFLGVDIFFVISGYLITGIIYKELNSNKFSIIGFYIRRTRRILPLTLFVVLASLMIGIAVMLPDDLENLAQSVVATNLFGNNVLAAITTKNYWDVVNEYKPLMHTWSLGVEEQYYIVYPLLLLLIGKYHSSWLLKTLSLLGIISLVLYFLPFKEHEKFYYLPFRFFELAAGGIAALYLKDKVVAHKYAAIIAGSLILILLVGPKFLPTLLALPIAVILTLGIIASDNSKSGLAVFVLQNKLSVGVGLISFSLYMWHQVLLAYFRYFVSQKIESVHLVLIFFLIIILSVCSYYLVERPFRNKNIISNRKLIGILGLLFIITTLPSLYIYEKGGVIRDVPELGINKSDSVRGIHAKYNHRIYDYDKQFSINEEKIKVLVIGNSFGRDWVNVLLESNFKSLIDISYIYNPFDHPEFHSRSKEADIIFYSSANREDVEQLDIDIEKLYVIGTKNYGTNNGYFYNYSGDNYFGQRTLMEDGYLERNKKLKREWRNRYIDLVSEVIDEHNTVPVFTPDNMFISQDCRHFTKAGAAYYANILENKLSKLFDIAKNRKPSEPANHSV